MGKSLIIVESPTKIKTLKKFLGSEFLIESSVGHIRDLPESEFGIDIENNFEPTYTILKDKKKVCDILKSAAKKSDVIYLCPDPDREGEAIAWHIQEILKEALKKGAQLKRVTFNAITKEAVLKGLDHPRDIDHSLVDAQQARRLLDRIVGYKISPILNKRIQRGRGEGVSAGRVQSVALKLVVDREKEIEAFVPIEYWKLAALLQKNGDEKQFRAALHAVDGQKIIKDPLEGEGLQIGNKETADKILNRMKEAPYIVEKVEKKEKRRFPVPPFITSTLQQEASRHFGFSSQRTMSVAQKLYEGIDMGSDGQEGLITYMRTDSVRVVPEAIQEARTFIQKTYGIDFLPDTPKYYTTKKSAQDAHEAIRPASLSHTPEKLEQYLSKEEFLLYRLIWRRFIASQMMPAVYDTMSVDIVNNKGILLRATGSIVKFQGFLAAYEEKVDEDEKSDEDRLLPKIEEGETLKTIDFFSEQSFTRPPPRFSEASLVKELEKSGIGRPSTYASIMNKIQSRDYTVKESGRLKPTELGRVIAALLENNFKDIMNVGFTANMEDDLELIAESKRNWKGVIKDFWERFEPQLELAEKEAFVPKIETDIPCPQCESGRLQKVWFKNKYFFGCTNYPECTFSAPIETLTFNKEEYAEDFDWDQKCPVCGSDMKIRHSRFGSFLGCSKYPECKGIVNIPKKGEKVIPESELPHCPAVGCPGKIVSKKSRFGKIFYSCSTFPECDVIANSVEALEEKYKEHPRTAYVKKERYPKKGKKEAKEKTSKKKAPAQKKKDGKKKESGKKEGEKKPAKELPVSGPLAEFLGTTSMSRGNITKAIWVYIKEKNLQDPNDKRSIIPDKALAKVLGTQEAVNMFKLPGLLNKHMK